MLTITLNQMRITTHKLQNLFIFAAIGILALSATRSDAQPNSADADAFAVVELFTSEGCSSCPSADKLLSSLTKKYAGSSVYTLSFHVDYWDYIGWKDPYASAAYSNRQRVYAFKLNSQSVYTPQMIVNGRYAFGGSRANLAEKNIQLSLNTPAQSDLAIELKNKKGQSLMIYYELPKIPVNCVLNIALAERGLTSRVTRGENAGKTLKHDNVVRAYKTVPLDEAAGVVHLEFADDVDMTNSSIVAYVQNTTNMHILDATHIELR